MSTLARFITYPIWAHAEYETSYDGIRELADSLSIGDVIQINDRKEPLLINQRDESGTLICAAKGQYEDTTYEIEHGDGRKYGTYFHRETSKKGIGRLAVIYRDDGSISSYTEADLRDILETANQRGLYEVTWENAKTTVSPIRSGDAGRPQIPEHDRNVDDESDAEEMVDDITEHLRSPEMQAIGRYQTGESPEDVDGLTQDTEFETKTKTVKSVQLPQEKYQHVPYGTMFFSVIDRERHHRTAVPIDSLKSISPVEGTDQSGNPT